MTDRDELEAIFHPLGDRGGMSESSYRATTDAMIQTLFRQLWRAELVSVVSLCVCVCALVISIAGVVA